MKIGIRTEAFAHLRPVYIFVFDVAVGAVEKSLFRLDLWLTDEEAFCSFVHNVIVTWIQDDLQMIIKKLRNNSLGLDVSKVCEAF